MLLKNFFVDDHSYHSIRAKMAGAGHSTPTPPTVFLIGKPKAESRHAELVISYSGFEGSAWFADTCNLYPMWRTTLKLVPRTEPELHCSDTATFILPTLRTLNACSRVGQEDELQVNYE